MTFTVEGNYILAMKHYNQKCKNLQKANIIKVNKSASKIKPEL